METLSIPRIFVSGTHCGVGKSFLVTGLVHELRRRGVSASVCVVGPRLMQSAIVRRISGRFVHCIDERLLSSGQILTTLFRAGIGSDVIIIDGRDGLFDSVGTSGPHESDADLARLIRASLLLCVDAHGYGETLAVLVKGLVQHGSGVDIGGVVLNRTERGSSAHGAIVRDGDFFKEIFQSFALPQFMGAIPRVGASAQLPDNEISQGRNSTALPFNFLNDMAESVRKEVQVDRIVDLAGLAGELQIDGFTHAPMGRRCRIAVSEDSCFSVCFQDNLELLRYFGAEIVTFSPLADEELPRKVGAVYLTGAFLSEYGEELEKNKGMRSSLQEFVKAGGVLYSEGSGTAFLCRNFITTEPEKSHEGVGIIDASAVGGSGSTSVTDAITIEESIIGRAGLLLKGMSTSEWGLLKDDRIAKVLKIARPGLSVGQEGFSPGPQVLSSFCFFHFGSNPQIAKNLVDAAEVVAPL